MNRQISKVYFCLFPTNSSLVQDVSRDVLGFEVAWGDENGDYAEFTTGDIKLALFKRQLMAVVVGSSEQLSSVERQDRIGLIFAVDDVNEVDQQL